MPSIEELNRLSDRDFREALEDVLEHSRWIVEGVVGQRPFESLEALHAAMCSYVQDASGDLQFALIAAHSDFADKLSAAGRMPEASAEEQQSAGLDQLTDAERLQLTQLNGNYTGTFSFPFVICVKDNTKEEILEAFQKRIMNDRDTELHNALIEIFKIAKQKQISRNAQS